MSSLYKRENGVYYVLITDATRTPKRVKISTGETQRRRAEAEARRIEDEIRDGKRPWNGRRAAVGPSAAAPLISARVPISEAVAPFLETKAHLARATRNGYEAVVGRFARWMPVGAPVASVETRHISDFITWTNVKPVTRHTYRRHLRVFFRWLVAEGALPADPTEGVRLARAPMKHPRFLTPEDVAALCAAVEKPIPFAPEDVGRWLVPVIRANVYLGLRRGEVCNLRWDAVDLERRTLTVRCTDEFTTKAARERTLPLAVPVLEVLRSIPRTSPYVFTGYGGEKLYDEHLSHTFKKYARRAGLPEEINFHATRHTAASWLMMQGASIEAVRMYLGHSSITVTQRYAHLSGAAYFDQVTAAFNRIV